MHVEWTITIGNIITLLGTIAGLLIFAWRISVKLTKVQMRVHMMWRDYCRRFRIGSGEDDD